MLNGELEAHTRQAEAEKTAAKVANRSSRDARRLSRDKQSEGEEMARLAAMLAECTDKAKALDKAYALASTTAAKDRGASTLALPLPLCVCECPGPAAVPPYRTP